MFQFTTTNVINSDKDLTTGKALWAYAAASGSKPATFTVKRVNTFKAPNVTAIYKAEAQDAEFAKVTLNLASVSGATKGETYRLHIYVGLSQASQSSLFANDLQWKGKPFSIDFVWEDNAANTAKKLATNISKYSAMVYNKKLLNVSYNSTFITIEATDEYERFRFVNIEKFDADAYHGMGEYTVVRSLANLTEQDTNADVTNSAEGYFRGKEGFGTYPFLLHNLRLPTYARTRWLALNQDETPIIGAKYNQYTIHYCTNRGILGDNAVGDEVKSRTTHVFYVNQTVSNAFETELKKIGDITTVDKANTPDPVEVSSTVTAGDGISVTGNKVSVKIDGDTLTASASGLKVADGKFTPAE